MTVLKSKIRLYLSLRTPSKLVLLYETEIRIFLLNLRHPSCPAPRSRLRPFVAPLMPWVGMFGPTPGPTTTSLHLPKLRTKFRSRRVGTTTSHDPPSFYLLSPY